MPNDIEKKKKKRAPLICAIVFIVLLSVYLAAVIFPLVSMSHGELVAIGVLILYGGVILAIIAGILIALRQRLREIDQGEEEDAKKY